MGDLSTARARVEVKLAEWSITPVQPSIAAGPINFHATNAGKEAHEMVVIRGSDPAGLPTKSDGSFDEEAVGEGTLVGEVEPFPANTACDATFNLSAGQYVLLCNVVEKEENGQLESHYKEGMRVAFTVS